MERSEHIDAYAPAEIARRVRDVGVSKAKLSTANLLALAVLAGAFIGIGACFSTLAVTGSDAGFGTTRLIAGLVFSLGLILVIVGGAELFTGNNLIAMAWADRSVTSAEILRNWLLVYIGNFVGAFLTVLLVVLSGIWKLGDHAVGATAVSIAAAKCGLPFVEAFFRGVLCNALVCMAIWLCFSARSTTDRILSIVFPITAFVALGFEHSIANMYFIPLGILLGGEPALQGSLLNGAGITWLDFARNLVPVTLGNIVGGTVLVAGLYWFIYLRPSKGER
jgi:formate/nitrite transporter